MRRTYDEIGKRRVKHAGRSHGAYGFAHGALASKRQYWRIGAERRRFSWAVCSNVRLPYKSQLAVLLIRPIVTWWSTRRLSGGPFANSSSHAASRSRSLVESSSVTSGRGGAPRIRKLGRCEDVGARCGSDFSQIDDPVVIQYRRPGDPAGDVPAAYGDWILRLTVQSMQLL